MILEDERTDINKVNERGFSPLSWALIHYGRHNPAVKLLTGKKAKKIAPKKKMQIILKQEIKAYTEEIKARHQRQMQTDVGVIYRFNDLP